MQEGSVPPGTQLLSRPKLCLKSSQPVICKPNLPKPRAPPKAAVSRRLWELRGWALEEHLAREACEARRGEVGEGGPARALAECWSREPGENASLQKHLLMGGP